MSPKKSPVKMKASPMPKQTSFAVDDDELVKDEGDISIVSFAGGGNLNTSTFCSPSRSFNLNNTSFWSNDLARHDIDPRNIYPFDSWCMENHGTELSVYEFDSFLESNYKHRGVQLDVEVSPLDAKFVKAYILDSQKHAIVIKTPAVPWIKHVQHNPNTVHGKMVNKRDIFFMAKNQHLVWIIGDAPTNAEIKTKKMLVTFTETLSNNVFGPEGTLDIKVEFEIMQAPVTMNGNQVGQVMATKVMHSCVTYLSKEKVKVELSEKQVTVEEQILVSLQRVSISSGRQSEIQWETLERERHEAATAKMHNEAKMEEQWKLDAELRRKMEEFEFQKAQFSSSSSISAAQVEQMRQNMEEEKCRLEYEAMQQALETQRHVEQEAKQQVKEAQWCMEQESLQKAKQQLEQQVQKAKEEADKYAQQVAEKQMAEYRLQFE
jgi:hypothetical protein